MANYRFYYFMTLILVAIGFYFFFYSEYPLFIILFIGLGAYHFILARYMHKYEDELENIKLLRRESMEVKVIFNNELVLDAELNDTATAKAVYDSLPLKGKGNTWGEEIYFSSNVEANEEDPREVLEVGDIAYWPPLKAICFFYGPTPASQGEEIRAAGPVNVIGKLKGDFSSLKELQGSIAVYIEKK